MNTQDLDLEWDDHTLRFSFRTPLTGEQRQQLALSVEKLFNVKFLDSYEAYRLEYDTEKETAFFAGAEQFDFE